MTDGCSITVDCKHFAPVSYKDIFVFASSIIRYCIVAHKVGGTAALIDGMSSLLRSRFPHSRPDRLTRTFSFPPAARERYWWVSVSDHGLTPSEVFQLRLDALSPRRGAKTVDLRYVTEMEKDMVQVFAKDSAKKLAELPKQKSRPETPNLAPGSPWPARPSLSRLRHGSSGSPKPMPALARGSSGSSKPRSWSPPSDMDWRNW